MDEEIKKILEDHEKRLKEIEKIVFSKKRKFFTQRKSILDHLLYLKSEGFFDQPKTLKEIVERLAQEGYHYPQQSLTEPLRRAVRQRVLGRIKQKGKWAYCKR